MLQIVGESLCEAADVRSDERVLGVAAGNGNATLAAARRYARVMSTDYVPGLLDRGRVRADAEGLAVATSTGRTPRAHGSSITRASSRATCTILFTAKCVSAAYRPAKQASRCTAHWEARMTRRFRAICCARRLPAARNRA